MPRPPFQPPERDKSLRSPHGDVRGKIVNALGGKPKLSERLGEQARDFIHGRQAYWENDTTDGRRSLTCKIKGTDQPEVKAKEAQRAHDLEAQKARELEPEFVQTAQDIGVLVERIRSIPDQAKGTENLRKLEALGKEIDPQVLSTMREATRALENAAKPLLEMLEDPQGGIAKLVISSEPAVYDTESPLKPLMDDMGEARQFDAGLAKESTDYAATQALEDSPELYQRYRQRLLKADPSRRMIYYAYLVDLITQFAQELQRFKDLHQLDTLFNQISKNHLHAMAEEVALPYGEKLDVLVRDRRYIREAKITEAERAKFFLEVAVSCLRVLEINRALHLIVGTIKPTSPKS